MKNNFFDKLDCVIDVVEDFLTKMVKCKWVWYILLIIVISLVYLFEFKIKISGAGIASNKVLKGFIVGLFVFIFIIIGLMIFNDKKNKMLIHKKYLIIGLILGIVYTFASPVFSQSDESFHFIRAYQVASGHLISPHDSFGNSYDNFPVSIYSALWDDDDIYPEYKNYNDIKHQLNIKLNKKDIVTKDVRASGYIFLNYIPQAIGIKIGRILNLSPYLVGMLGRIFNVVACTLLIYLGLKIIPIGKKTMAILLLSPTVLAYNASMSADGLVIAMSFLLISLVLKCLYDCPKLNAKWYILYLLIVMFVSTCKIAYLPIIGIVSFLPYECFKDKKTKWLYSLSLIIFGIVMSVAWMKISNIQLEMTSNYNGIMKYLNFLRVFVITIANDIFAYAQNVFAGNYLYQARVKPYAFISVIYIFIFVLSFLSENSKLKIRNIEKIIVFLIGLLIFGLISYALFTSNTSIDSNLINGIQGRYFIPILLMLPFFMNKQRIKLDDIKLFDITVILNFCVLLTMMSVFAL